MKRRRAFRPTDTTFAVLPALVLLGVVSAAHPARAQLLDQFVSPAPVGSGIEPGVTVASRARPEYVPGGVRVGGFVIRPLVTESVGYESNVLGTSSAQGSPVVQSSAAVEAASDWSRNSARITVTADDFRFTDLPRQSFTNWTVAAGGTYEFDRDVASASYSHLNLHQTPRDLDVPQLDQALTYRVDVGRLAYRANFNRLSLTPAVEAASYSYDDGTVLGAPYRQGYRNRVVVSPSLTAGYELAPRRNLVVVVRDSDATYVDHVRGTPRRDYNDVTVLAGFEYDATGLLSFRLLGGYEVRQFASAAFKTIQAPVAEGSVTWTPTGLTTVTAVAARRIQDSADETTAGLTQTSIRFRVDHEYLRNVLFQANAGAYLTEYTRGVSDQVLYTVGAGATYLLNRNVRLGATYDFISRQTDRRSSTLGTTGQRFGSSYNDNRVLLQLRFGL